MALVTKLKNLIKKHGLIKTIKKGLKNLPPLIFSYRPLYLYEKSGPFRISCRPAAQYKFEKVAKKIWTLS